MIAKTDAERADEDQAEAERKRYCQEHPRSPSALRRPKLMRRGKSWIALLGSTLQEGIAGIGNSVEASLRAFDVQYRRSCHSPTPR